MNLQRDNWEFITLGSVCQKVENVDIRKQSGNFNYIDIGSIDSELKRVSETKVLNWKDASSRARQVITQGDTLFSTVRVNLERIAYLNEKIENTIASTGFTVIRANPKKADSRFLFYVSSSPDFINKLSAQQKGTAYPAVTDKIVFSQVIPLPPLEEQPRFAKLFQSLESSIEEVDKEELRLRRLQKNLSNNLLNKEPSFGNLLNINHCTHVTFDNIVYCIEQHDKQKTDVSRFIGLENIEPENFKITTWGEIENGTTFTKRFSKGDVLFGKRRAYLKKVAVADFDGICSSDILVLRANERIMLPELLPIYISAEAFIQHAVNTSAGSLSPRTKWRDLAEFEVSIPDLKTQEKILEVFKKLLTTIEQLKKQKVTLRNLKQNLLREILG